MGGTLSVIMQTNIPGEVRDFHYVRNHHYLKLKDNDGNETTLLEHGIIEYYCASCKERWWSECNRSTVCPCCHNTDIQQRWVQPQVALLPERESGFKLVKMDKS